MRGDLGAHEAAVDVVTALDGGPDHGLQHELVDVAGRAAGGLEDSANGDRLMAAVRQATVGSCWGAPEFSETRGKPMTHRTLTVDVLSQATPRSVLRLVGGRNLISWLGVCDRLTANQ